MIYFHLFLAFLQIGAFSFGGGYAALPLIQEQVIDRFHWMTISEFTDLVTISQLTPGPIAINAATFVGNQTAGIPGALIATFGCILPSCVFVTILAWLYTRYRSLDLLQGTLEFLRPAVVAMIAAAGIVILLPVFFTDGQIAGHQLQIQPVLIFGAALFLLRRKKLDPVLVMVLCGIAQALISVIQ